MSCSQTYTHIYIFFIILFFCSLRMSDPDTLALRLICYHNHDNMMNITFIASRITSILFLE